MISGADFELSIQRCGESGISEELHLQDDLIIRFIIVRELNVQGMVRRPL